MRIEYPKSKKKQSPPRVLGRGGLIVFFSTDRLGTRLANSCMGGRLGAYHPGTYQSNFDILAVELTRKIPFHLARLVAVRQAKQWRPDAPTHHKSTLLRFYTQTSLGLEEAVGRAAVFLRTNYFHHNGTLLVQIKPPPPQWWARLILSNFFRVKNYQAK